MAMAAVVLAAPAAGPASAAADPEHLDVQVGYAGHFVPGKPVVVKVKISPARLVSGTLTVRTGADSTVSRKIEVAGGSVKEFAFTLATESPVDTAAITAQVRRGGKLVATGEGSAEARRDEEVVGLLPGLAGSGPLPSPGRLAVDVGTVRFAKVGPAELHLAPAGLAGLHILAAARGELAALPADQQADVRHWIATGGRLMVDEAPGEAVPGLTVTTQGDGRGRLGRGEVVAAAGAMAAGRWDNLVEPTEQVRRQDFDNGDSINDTVARAAGLRQAGLGGLIIFLFVYVLAVGPVLFLVLSRGGRRHLAWLGVPALAVLFTAGAYVIGRGLRNNAKPAHTSVLVMSSDRTEARSWVGLVSQRGGTAKLHFPARWSVGGGHDQFGNRHGASEVEATGDGLVAKLPLGPGEFGVVEGHGTVSVAGRLSVTGRFDGVGSGSGTIANNLPYAVRDVVIEAWGSTAVIGDMVQGEQRQWSVAPAPAFNNRFGFRGDGPSGDPVVDAWQSGRSFNSGASFRDFRGQVQLVGQARDMLGRSSGIAGVTAWGWVDDFRPPVGVRGGQRLTGTTLVVTPEVLELGPGLPPPSAATLLRGQVLTNGSGPTMVTPDQNDIVIAVEVGPTLDPAKAAASVPLTATTEVWVAGAWRQVSAARENTLDSPPPLVAPKVICPPGASCAAPQILIDDGARVLGRAPLPAGSVFHGRVYLRITGLSQQMTLESMQVAPA
jgi:hypothetical protein